MSLRGITFFRNRMRVPPGRELHEDRREPRPPTSGLTIDPNGATLQRWALHMA